MNYKILLILLILSLSSMCYSKESEKTLLIFGASWCKFCIESKKDLQHNETLSELVKNYSVIELDFDKEKGIALGHNVKSIPTFIIYQNGKEVKRQVGYKGANSLINFLK
jgi:thioredoxin 1